MVLAFDGELDVVLVFNLFIKCIKLINFHIKRLNWLRKEFYYSDTYWNIEILKYWKMSYFHSTTSIHKNISFLSVLFLYPFSRVGPKKKNNHRNHELYFELLATPCRTCGFCRFKKYCEIVRSYNSSFPVKFFLITSINLYFNVLINCAKIQLLRTHCPAG